MSSQPNQDRDKQIQEDILSGRHYSLADAIAREGGNFLQGESPVPKLVQVTTEINLFIDQNLPDQSGALQSVLKHWVKSDPIVSQNLEYCTNWILTVEQRMRNWKKIQMFHAGKIYC